MAIAAGFLLYTCGSYFLDHGPPHGLGVPDYPIREWGHLWSTLPFVGAGIGFVLSLFGLLPGTALKR